MLTVRSALLARAAFATAFIALGCGQVDSNNPPGGQGGRAGSAMGTGAAGAAGSSGSGGMNMGGASGSEGDAGPETGAANGGSGGFMYPDGCPEPNPIPADGNQVVVIQSINFATSQIVIRNVSSDPVTITGGPEGWQWCNIPAYWQLVDEDLDLEPDQTLAFYLIQRGNAQRLVYPGDDRGESNELGIYVTSGSYDETDLIAAFVSWGFGTTGGREVVATEGGKWTFGERVEIGPGDDGFIITGNADEGAGYTSVPERCLVAPPNPPGAAVLPLPGQ